MAFPAGVTTATLTASSPVDAIGQTGQSLAMSVQPIFGDGVAQILHAESGIPLSSVVAQPTAGSTISAPVPHVDQPGFVDGTGAAYTMWTYLVTVRWVSALGEPQMVRKYVSPLTGQDVVDVDELPDGSVGVPITAPVPEVVSVAGLVGAVGAEELAGELAPYLPPDGPVDLLAFNTAAPVPSYAAGQVFWDAAEGTLAVQTGFGDQTLQVGQEQVIRVRNATGATIPNGSPVKVTGVVGNRPSVSLAVDGDPVRGVVTHDIANNSDGLMCVGGIVRGLDTSAFALGGDVFVSDTVPGALAPTGTIKVGTVLRVHGTQGSIQVDVLDPDLQQHVLNNITEIMALEARVAALELALTSGSTVSLTGIWQVNPTAGAVPGGRQVTSDTGIFGTAGWLRFDPTDKQNVDLSNALENCTTIYAQQMMNASNWVRYTVSSASVVGGYVQVAVTPVGSAGSTGAAAWQDAIVVLGGIPV